MGNGFNFLFEKTSTDDHCLDIGICNRGRMGSKAHPEHRVLVRELGNSLLLGFKASFCIFLFISIRFFYWSVTPKEIFTRKKTLWAKFWATFSYFWATFWSNYFGLTGWKLDWSEEVGKKVEGCCFKKYFLSSSEKNFDEENLDRKKKFIQFLE